MCCRVGPGAPLCLNHTWVWRIVCCSSTAIALDLGSRFAEFGRNRGVADIVTLGVDRVHYNVDSGIHHQ